MDVTLYGALRRDLNNLDLFNGIGTATYLGYREDEVGYVLEFDGPLTDEEVRQVRRRARSTEDEEASLVVLESLDIEAITTSTDTMSTAELADAVRTLGEAVAELRSLVLDTIEPQ